RHFRTQAGLTLRELAERAGTTPSHLSLIENGHREPRLALLKDLAEVLDVDVGILLTAEPPPDRRAELEIELQRAQRSPHYRSLGVRSEEHTSELQSRFDLVCRLLLE